MASRHGDLFFINNRLKIAGDDLTSSVSFPAPCHQTFINRKKIVSSSLLAVLAKESHTADRSSSVLISVRTNFLARVPVFPLKPTTFLKHHMETSLNSRWRSS